MIYPGSWDRRIQNAHFGLLPCADQGPFFLLDNGKIVFYYEVAMARMAIKKRKLSGPPLQIPSF